MNTTSSSGATLFVGKAYRGAGGGHLVEPFDTRPQLTCKQAGYKDGKLKLARVIRAGRTSMQLARMARGTIRYERSRSRS